MMFAVEQLMGLVVSPSNDDQTVEMLPVGVKPRSLTAVARVQRSVAASVVETFYAETVSAKQA